MPLLSVVAASGMAFTRRWFVQQRRRIEEEKWGAELTEKAGYADVPFRRRFKRGNPAAAALP